jgi:hypothetical protein
MQRGPSHRNGFSTRSPSPIRMPCCMFCDHSRAQPFSVAAAAIIESENREPVAFGEVEPERVRLDRDRRHVEQATDHH